MGLMDSTYTYEKLQSKYKNFTIPAAKLLIGGTNILGIKEITVQSIQIRLSLDSAGSATFSMNGDYDYKIGSFQSQLKSKAVLGKIVEVELGYGSDTTRIFKGFLASLMMNFDVESGITYEITALDARRLMMSDNRRETIHKIKNYSDAVNTVLKRYKKLCSLEVTATQDNLEDAVIVQKGSDYDFIVRKLIGEGMVDREFFVVADKAYFRKPKGSSSPMLTLEVGKGLKSFRRSSSYLNQTIQFLGQEEGTGNKLKGEALAKNPDPQDSNLLEPGLVVEQAPDCHSESDLKKRAQSQADKLQDDNNKASASCVGLPEIVPGRYIKIDRVDSSVNKKYYVTGVTHSYSMGGFVTTMDMEGWK